VRHFGARLPFALCGARLLVASLCMSGDNESSLTAGRGSSCVVFGARLLLAFVGRGSLLQICACQEIVKASSRCGASLHEIDSWCEAPFVLWGGALCCKSVFARKERQHLMLRVEVPRYGSVGKKLVAALGG